MMFKRMLLVICLFVCLFSMARVCASDTNDTMVASDDANQIELSVNDEMSMDNPQTSR